MGNIQIIENGPDGHVSYQGEAVVMALPKELTVVEAVPFRDAFRIICERVMPPQKVNLDFSKTSFMDSSGIGALVSILKMSKSADIQLSVSGLCPQIRAVLVMTGLAGVLNIEPVDTTTSTSSTEETARFPITHASIRSGTKRVIDIVGALAGLTITAVLFIPIAVAIRSEGGGALLFSQTRCGWMGRPFKLWKFRSMVLDAEARKHEVKNDAKGAIFKAKNDPRITKVGRFLRRTSLDELPQFWNVLEGSMSLVGTRPPTREEIEQYDVPEWRRLDVKPGITGEWQVYGRSSIKEFEDIIRLDLRYQRNWSLTHDIKLLFKTLNVVFRKDSGAM